MSLPRSAAPGTASWRPTLAHVRAGGLGVAFAVLALVLQRPDALVLGAPLLAVFAWGQVTRPVGQVRFDMRADRSTVREGESLALVVRAEAPVGTEALAVSLRPNAGVGIEPGNGAMVVVPERAARAGAPDDGDARDTAPERLVFTLGAQRWGRRIAGPGLVGGVSACGAYRFGPAGMPSGQFLALPRPSAFDAAAPVPRPRGLVGVHRSARPREGAEFYALREFRPGDRMRRVHWPRSIREGSLYVRATHADEDTHVALVLDAHQDLTPPDQGPSTLDLGVRSAAAVAEHFLGTGDRVGLTVLSAHRLRPIRPMTGRRHLRTLLVALARVTPRSGREDGPVRERLPHLSGALVVLVSPLASPDVAGLAARIAASGHTVLVIDVLGGARSTGAGASDLAWRIRALERAEEIHALRAHGVPVVPWVGPGSLDLVLRELAHRRPTVRQR